MPVKSSKVLNEFDQRQETLAKYTSLLRGLIERLLGQAQIRLHSISSRTKDRACLERKLRDKANKYSGLDDITDLCGIRVITHFQDEVDAVAEIVESEFQIDRSNSIDKSAALDPDRFGYLSLHYVVSLNSHRSALTEYASFSGLKAEVQIRTIIQHAWAEIEHDLGYKSEQAIPHELQRRFFRLAALLEVADAEFSSLKAATATYKVEVKKRLAANSLSTVSLDAVSLVAFIQSNELVHEIDTAIAEIFEGEIREMWSEEVIGAVVEELRYCGLDNMESILTSLEEKRDLILKLVRTWKKERHSPSYPRGISVFFLCYMLPAQNGKASLENYLNKFNIGTEHERPRIAADILRVVGEVSRRSIRQKQRSQRKK